MPRYYPQPGLIVPDPARQFAPVPPAGIELPEQNLLPQYWARRWLDGDLTLTAPATAPATASPPAPASTPSA